MLLLVKSWNLTDHKKQGDAGGACTNVVTEFRQMPQTIKSGAVHAEVQFYCLEYCNHLVTTWFTQWFTTKQKEMQDEDIVDDDDKARRDAALECLELLFSNRIKCGSLEEFMSNGKTVKDNTALTKLLEWTIDIHMRFVKKSVLSVSLEASTANDMREQLRPFRMKAPNGRFKNEAIHFHPWPFVEIIR